MATLIFWAAVVLLFVWFNITTEPERGRIWRTLVVCFVLIFGTLIGTTTLWTLVTKGPIAALHRFGDGSAPPSH